MTETAILTLDKMKPDDEAVITKVGGEGPLRLRLLDMGLIPGTKIRLTKVAPLGDPMQFHLRGYELTLRKEDAAVIDIAMTSPTKAQGGEKL